jgi:uncharacterized protein (DUF952 family)
MLPTDRDQSMILFHITTRAAWERARELGSYQPQTFAAEGFIHLSEERQWLATANRFYSGQHGLVLLALQEDRLAAEVRREPADGDLFPHLYGALNLDAVTAVYDLPLSEAGTVLALPNFRPEIT